MIVNLFYYVIVREFDANSFNPTLMHDLYLF